MYSPQMCMYTNGDRTAFILEIMLPGVEKDDIRLEINEKRIHIIGETNSTKYFGNYRLYRPINPIKVKVNYNNGLMRINAPFKGISSDI